MEDDFDDAGLMAHYYTRARKIKRTPTMNGGSPRVFEDFDVKHYNSTTVDTKSRAKKTSNTQEVINFKKLIQNAMKSDYTSTK